MVDMPSGFDWYDGSKKGGQRLDLLRRPWSSKWCSHIGDRRVRVIKN